MRRFLSIVKATAVELLDDPLSLLVSLSAASLSVLAPTLHYHQFGECTRMARDAGLSAIFLGGAIICITGAVRSIRREFESKTAEMVLSRAVCRHSFLFAKYFGVLFSYLVFIVTLSSLSLVMITGAKIGGEAAAKIGDVPKMHGISFAIATSVVILAPAIAGFMNRFFKSRFVLTANLTLMFLALISLAYKIDFNFILKFLPVVFTASLPQLFFSATAGAMAVRFKSNAASLAGVLSAVVFIPFVGSFYLPEALAKGGSLGWSYALMAFLSIIPWVLASLLTGAALLSRKEV